MKKPIIYLIFSLFLLFIVLLLVFLMNKSAKNPIPGQSPIVVTPEPEITAPKPPSVSSSDFKIIGTSLTEKPLGTTESFSIFFSKPISYKEFSYTIDPPVAVNISLNPKKDTVTVLPQQTWGFNASYKITINRDTLSSEGDSLKDDFVLNFKSVPFKGF